MWIQGLVDLIWGNVALGFGRCEVGWRIDLYKQVMVNLWFCIDEVAVTICTKYAHLWSVSENENIQKRCKSKYYKTIWLPGVP